MFWDRYQKSSYASVRDVILLILKTLKSTLKSLYGNAWGAPIEFSFVHFVNFLFFYCQLYKNSLQKILTMSSSFLQRQISVIILKSSQ